MTHVAHDASVLHLVHVFARDHIFIARRCNNNVYISNDFIEFHHSEAVHAVMRQHICIGFLSGSADDLAAEIKRMCMYLPGLQSAYGIDLGDIHDAT